MPLGCSQLKNFSLDICIKPLRQKFKTLGYLTGNCSDIHNKREPKNIISQSPVPYSWPNMNQTYPNPLISEPWHALHNDVLGRLRQEDCGFDYYGLHSETHLQTTKMRGHEAKAGITIANLSM